MKSKQDRCKENHAQLYHGKMSEKQRQKENLKNRQREKECIIFKWCSNMTDS